MSNLTWLRILHSQLPIIVICESGLTIIKLELKLLIETVRIQQQQLISNSTIIITHQITQNAEIIIIIFIYTRGTVPITHKTRHQQANKISTNTNAKYAVLNNAIIRKCM